MKKLRVILAGVVLVLGFIFILHAQEVVPTTSDSVVRLTAEAHGLSLLSPGDLSENENGTFWNASSNGIMAPWPCPPPNAAYLPKGLS